MAFFVIAGKNTCLNTTHALFVAEHLSKRLPHFTYRTILTTEEEWPSWLDQTNSTYNWHEIRSPLIWKEVNRRGGKAYLIGSLGEFWEYLYDHYGFQSKMSREDLEKIQADNLLIASKLEQIKTHVISIIGGNNQKMLEMTVLELHDSYNLGEGEVMEIRIFDPKEEGDLEGEEKESLLLDLVENLRECSPGAGSYINVVPSQEYAIQNCDLLIVITDYSRRPKEEVNAWLDRCKRGMILLAEDISYNAKKNLKVILNHHGPVCFNASILLEYCSRIRLTNIVAVTADEGISLINMMSEKIEEPVRNFWCPPVWGFSGLLSDITVVSTPITSEVIRPYKRSLTIKETSHLPKGCIQREIRFLGNLIKIDDDLFREIEEKKAEELRLLKRPTVLPKIRAFGSLLKLWFADQIGDEIISLGIRSNGAFGFPKGICFSQAVYLDQGRTWVPISNLPLHSSTSAKIQEISLQVENTLHQFGLGQRADVNDKEHETHL